MNVLSSVVDPRLGGPQRRSLDVATELRDREIETRFLIPEGSDEFDDAATEAGFETYRLPMPRIRPPKRLIENVRFIAAFPQTTRRISSLIRSEPVNVVHANMSINFQTALAAAWTDTPLAWHFNDTLVPTPLRQVAGGAGCRLADELVVAADAVHDFYFPSSADSRTIYAPVDLDRFDPRTVDADQTRLRAELSIPADVPIVGTIGNLNPIKGHEYLLRAVAELIERGQEVVVPIVGARLDSQVEYHQQLLDLRSSLDLDAVVHFVGFRSDIPEMLSLFDVFVLPSVAEACPIVVLEAMAMECPIIATDVGGVSEQLPGPEYGWVVPPEDDSALADSIETAITSPERCRECATNARKRVESEFSLDICVDRHESLYRELAGK
jgi:glycosyltransferase involved in cell wall biosynthesis